MLVEWLSHCSLIKVFVQGMISPRVITPKIKKLTNLFTAPNLFQHVGGMVEPLFSQNQCFDFKAWTGKYIALLSKILHLLNIILLSIANMLMMEHTNMVF